jgi:hypothetical protein
MAGIGATPSGPVVAEDIRDLQDGSDHGRALCGRRVSPGAQRREAVERAHDRADRVGGHPRTEAGGLELGMSERS